MKFKTKALEVDVGSIDLHTHMMMAPPGGAPAMLVITCPNGRAFTLPFSYFAMLFDPADDMAQAFAEGLAEREAAERRAAHAYALGRPPPDPMAGGFEYEMRTPGQDPEDATRVRVSPLRPLPSKDKKDKTRSVVVGPTDWGIYVVDHGDDLEQMCLASGTDIAVVDAANTGLRSEYWSTGVAVKVPRSLGLYLERRGAQQAEAEARVRALKQAAERRGEGKADGES